MVVTILDKSAKLFLLFRPPERSRRNRRPHVSRSKTPTANAIVRTDGLPRDGQAERRAEAAKERSDIGGKGTLDSGTKCQKTGRSVGSRGMSANGGRHRTRWPDDWGSGHLGLFSPVSRGKSVQMDMASMRRGRFSWTLFKGSMPAE